MVCLLIIVNALKVHLEEAIKLDGLTLGNKNFLLAADRDVDRGLL